MHFPKSFQGSKKAITMRPVSVKSTLLLFFVVTFWRHEITEKRALKIFNKLYLILIEQRLTQTFLLIL